MAAIRIKDMFWISLLVKCMRKGFVKVPSYKLVTKLHHPGPPFPSRVEFWPFQCVSWKGTICVFAMKGRWATILQMPLKSYVFEPLQIAHLWIEYIQYCVWGVSCKSAALSSCHVHYVSLSGQLPPQMLDAHIRERHPVSHTSHIFTCRVARGCLQHSICNPHTHGQNKRATLT